MLMKLGAFFKRGANLLKLGLAARKIRRSTTKNQRQWAQNYLVELWASREGCPPKLANS